MLELFQRQNELVHANARHGGLVAALHQRVHQVIGVENRARGGLGDALRAQREHVAQRLDHHAEVAVELLDAAHGLRRPLEAVVPRLAHDLPVGQKIAQKRLHAHRAAAGAAAAMGRGEGLVQVEMHHVKAHVAGAGDAHDGVEVGAIVVAEAAGFVDDLGDLQYVLVKDSQRVGVGEHQPRRVRAGERAQRLHVHAAVGR